MAMLNNQMVMFLANPNDIMIALDHSGMIYSRLYHMMLGGEKNEKSHCHRSAGELQLLPSVHLLRP